MKLGFSTLTWRARSIVLKRKGKQQTQRVMAGVQTRNGIGALLALIARVLVLTTFGAIVIFPFFWMVNTSFKSFSETLNPDSFVPAVAQTSNYSAIFNKDFGLALAYSLLITIISSLSTLVIIIPAAYAFAKINFMGKKLLWGLFLAILALPEIALLSGQYKLIVQMGLQEGPGVIVALFLPFISSVGAMYLLRNAFESVPNNYVEAAMIDGASQLKVFVKIILPSVRGAIYMSMIFSIIASWNSYTWPSLILSSGRNFQTLPIWLFTTGIQEEQGTVTIQSNIRMAAAVIVILPLLGFYVVMRRRILSAVASRSGIKG